MSVESAVLALFHEVWLTRFGGTMAMADLGVMEIWWGLLSDLSPLTERRNICGELGQRLMMFAFGRGGRIGYVHS